MNKVEIVTVPKDELRAMILEAAKCALAEQGPPIEWLTRQQVAGRAGITVQTVRNRLKAEPMIRTKGQTVYWPDWVQVFGA